MAKLAQQTSALARTSGGMGLWDLMATLIPLPESSLKQT